MNGKAFAIAGREIGPGNSPYVVAELGINHGGEPEEARRMLAAAVDAGADAIKLQVYETGSFLARSSAYFDVLRRAELPREAIANLMALARERGTTLFAAVFDEASADAMATLDAPAFKIASGDLTHHPLLAHVARIGKPMIVSTGGATLEEIVEALAVIGEAGTETPVALLHCVSNYPTDSADTNLACMRTLRARFDVPVGFSDHTFGNAVAIAAAALGADIIEKHFTLDRNADGPDHALSVDPSGLKELAEGVRSARAAVGSADKSPVESGELIQAIRRSLTAAVDIPEGTVIELSMLAVKRPAVGLAPGERGRVVGTRTTRHFSVDEPITRDGIQ